MIAYVKVEQQGRHWTASFPEYPGKFANGFTRVSAIRYAKDALEAWMSEQLDKGVVPVAAPVSSDDLEEVKLSQDIGVRVHSLTVRASAPRAKFPGT